MPGGSKDKTAIHWFRKGLRLHDNPALIDACVDSKAVYPVFILDPWFVSNANVGKNRWRFLVQSLQDLDNSFKAFNLRLYVVKGKPAEVFPKLFKEWNISHLTFESDTEPYAVKRDLEIKELAKDHQVDVKEFISHTLYDTEKVIAKNGGTPPMTYQRCQTVLSQMGPPKKPCGGLQEEHLKDCKNQIEKNHESVYGVPSLKDLGVDESILEPELYPGGETEALLRLERSLQKSNWVCQFEKPKTEPNSLKPSTTVLSPYLKFGCLSARTFYWKLKEIYAKMKHSSPPVSLEGQLLWREFFYTVGSVTPNYDKMVGNPICRQIPWEDNPDHLEAWKNGKTGFPYIDAIMTQLRKEGWIHHLARHSVACFLTRGDLWISWEEGQKVFEELLLDADWSLNAANWMWLSASAFFHQFFRVYSPIAFGKKTDKQGEYIKKYIPKLKKYPANYIYEPWKAPLSVQQAAGCIIGKDYPKPIVDHDVVSKRNIQRMKEAYAKGKTEAANGKSQKRKAESTSSSTPKKSKKKSN